jgi:hypothetical protein
MVHALDEIRGTLKSNGILIDLRPVASNWGVEISSPTGDQPAVKLIDMSTGLADDDAAFKAIKEAETRGWFVKKKEEAFSLFYYFDTPSEMKEYIETEWEDFEKLEEDDYQKVKSLWAVANADARVRIRIKMSVTRWEKWWS